MDERGGPPEVTPADVMGYHTERHLPVYDHLSEKFLICDRWFSSVCGSTFPNRLYSVAGRAAGSRNNISPPIYKLKSFVRHLDEVKGVSWGWFVHDVAPIVWAVNRDYPLLHTLDHVAWFETATRRPTSGSDSCSARRPGSSRTSRGSTRASPTSTRACSASSRRPRTTTTRRPTSATARTWCSSHLHALASSPQWEKIRAGHHLRRARRLLRSRPAAAGR